MKKYVENMEEYPDSGALNSEISSSVKALELEKNVELSSSI